MLLSVLVILSVPDDTKRDDLARLLEGELRHRGHNVKWAVPLQYTLEAPPGTVTSAMYPGVPA